MADIFLSYRNTPARRAYVERLKIALDAYSISAWWDYGLEAGQEFEPQIMAELHSAGLICPLWCKESVLSAWVAKEAQYGLDHGKLLPARLEAVAPPQPFESTQAQDLLGWDGSVESHMVTAFAAAVARRLGRPLVPLADKLRALRSLSPLKPLELEALSDVTLSKRWESLETSLDIRRLEIFIEETPPGTPERFAAREHKLQLEDWAKVNEEDPDAIQRFLRTEPFPALRKLASVRAAEARVINQLSSFRDQAMPEQDEAKLRHFMEGYKTSFGLASVTLTFTDEAMIALADRISGKSKSQVLELFDSILIESLSEACLGRIEEVLVNRDCVDGRASPLRVYSP